MLIVLLTCVSCSPDHPNEYRLVAKETLSFKNAEEHDIPSTEVKHYSIAGRSFITFYDHKQEALLIYDLDERSKCIKVEVGAAIQRAAAANLENDFMINGYFVRSLDSIYVLLNPLNEILLIDGNSTVLKTWKVSAQRINTQKEFYLLSFFGDAPIEMIGNRLITLQQLPDPDYATNPDLLRSKFAAYIDAVIEFDQDTAVVVAEVGLWPKMYQLNYYNDVTPCRTIDNRGRLVYSFGVSDSLQVWELDGQHKSIHIPGIAKKFVAFDGQRESDVAYTDRYVVEQPRYRKLIYDPYNDVYYRVVIREQHYTTPENELNLYSDKSWSIQLLDADLALKGVVDFKPREHNFETLLVTPRGLMIELKEKRPQSPHDPTFMLYELVRDIPS